MTAFLIVTAVVVVGFGAAVPWVFYLERKQRERSAPPAREQTVNAPQTPLTDAEAEALLTGMQQSLAELQAHLRHKRDKAQPDALD